MPKYIKQTVLLYSFLLAFLFNEEKRFKARTDCKKANKKALCTWLILLMYLKSPLYHTDFNHCTVVGASESWILNTIYPEDQNSILKIALTHK